jgi:hypothetical protein
MTLILSLAAPQFVVQVCDRRVTEFDTSKLVTDEAIKMVAFGNQIVFSFTGLAVIERKKTDQWLQDELVGLPTTSVFDACKHIAARATEAFRRNPCPHKYKSHAFVGVGFAGELPDLVPMIARVSNFHDSRGQSFEEAQDIFVCNFFRIRDGTETWIPTGCDLTPKEYFSWCRQMRRIARKTADVELRIKVMTDVIRQVSRRLNNKWVGKSVLAAALPRCGVGTTPLVFLGPRRRGDGAVTAELPEGGAVILGDTFSGVVARLDEPNKAPDLRLAGWFSSIPEGDDTGDYDGPRIACPTAGAISGIAVRVKPPSPHHVSGP